MNTARRPTKRLLMLAAILIVGVVGHEFFNASYVFRELLFVIGCAALAVFFAAGLAVLAIVFESAWQNLMTHVRQTKVRVALQKNLGASVSRPLISRGVYEHENRIKA